MAAEPTGGDASLPSPTSHGRIAGFQEFCANAEVLEYKESEELIQTVGNAGFVSFRFDMLYQRTQYRERSAGRDIWSFERIDKKWLAVWRTIVELKEDREQKT